MKLMLILTGVFLLAAVGMALAAERPVYPCYKVTMPPTIDGKLDDPVWKALPKATGFLLPGRRRMAVLRQTEFRAGYDEQNLYLAVRCFEPDAGKPGVNCGSIELFVTTQLENPGVYYQCGVNADGTGYGPTRFTKNMSRATQLSDPGYKVATSIEAGSWCCELRIPLTLFKEQRLKGRDWLFNISRYAPAGSPDGEAFSTWSFLPKLHWHLFINYYPIQFEDTASTSAQVAAAEQQLNAEFQRGQAGNLAAYHAYQALRTRLKGLPNLAVNPPNTPVNAQVKDNAWGNLVGQKGVTFQSDKTVVLEVTWPKPVAFDTFLLNWEVNDSRLVHAYTLEYWDGQQWLLLKDVKDNEEAIAVHQFTPVTGSKLRLRIYHAHGSEMLKDFGVYLLAEH